jgi:hypothetical protein
VLKAPTDATRTATAPEITAVVTPDAMISASLAIRVKVEQTVVVFNVLLSRWM